MTKKTESNHSAYSMLVSTVVLWGGANVAGKFVVQDIPPLTVAGIRMALASGVLLFLLSRKEGFSLPAKRDWPMFVTLGALGIFGANALLYVGLKYTSVTNASLVASGSPIIITLLSAFMLKQRISIWQIIAIFLSFLGVLVVLTKGNWSILVNLNFNFGDVIVLGVPVCWGLYTVLTNKIVHRYSPLLLGTYSTLIGALVFVPFMVYELIVGWSGIQVTVIDVGAIAYSGLLSTTIGNLWWNRGIKKVGASRAGIFMNGVPICAMAFSALLLGEKIALTQILGAFMVIMGVYLNSKRSGQSFPKSLKVSNL